MSTASRPARSRVAHELKLRTVTVRAVTDLTAHLRRVTLTGAALEDFASVGPTDHIKLFLADPSTGLVHLPDGNGGVTPPGGASVRRDMTPRAFRPDSASGGPELDLDNVVLVIEDVPFTASAEDIRARIVQAVQTKVAAILERRGMQTSRAAAVQVFGGVLG